MQGQTVAGRPAGADAPLENSGELSPGLERLVAPRTPTASPDPDADARLAPLREKLARLKPALFLADFALLALPAWFAFSRRGTLGVLDIVLCLAAVLTGAALGLVALTPDEDE